MDLAAPIIALLVLAVFGAAFVNGIFGFGFALLAVVALGIALGAKEGVIVMSLLTPVMSGMQLWRFRDRVGIWSRLRWLLAGALVGSVIGTQLLVVLPGWAISLALGGFTVWYVIGALRRERPPIRAAVERRLAPAVGLVAGISNGTIGASGPVLGSYLTAIGLRRQDFVAGISIIFFAMSLARVSLLGALGQYTVPIVVAALVLVVPSWVGQRTGFWMQGRLRAELFQRAILVVLLVASALLLGRGLEGLLQALS